MAKQNFKVIDPTQKVAGRNQSALASRWWKYAYGIPVDQHFGPFDDRNDPRGKLGSVERARNNQPFDNLLFIGGAFEVPGNDAGIVEIHRTIVLPNDVTTVFFPILNVEADNLTTDPSPDLNDPTSFGGRNADQLKELADFYIKPIERVEDTGTFGVFANINGQDIQNPYQYRQTSETTFSYNLIENGLIRAPEDELYIADPDLANTVEPTEDNPEGYPTVLDLGGYGDPDARVGLAIADGYHLGVELGAGAHTLHFGGDFVGGGVTGFSLDVTYNILNPVYGTQKNDELLGTGKNDYIEGKDGSDTLSGLQGYDLIVGGKKADTMDGGVGDDELWGNQGADKYIFQEGYGKDTIFDAAVGETVKLSGFTDVDGKEVIELPSGGIAVQVSFNRSDSLIFIGYDNPDNIVVENNKIQIVESMT